MALASNWFCFFNPSQREWNDSFQSPRSDLAVVIRARGEGHDLDVPPMSVEQTGHPESTDPEQKLRNPTQPETTSKHTKGGTLNESEQSNFEGTLHSPKQTC